MLRITKDTENVVIHNQSLLEGAYHTEEECSMYVIDEGTLGYVENQIFVV